LTEAQTTLCSDLPHIFYSMAALTLMKVQQPLPFIVSSAGAGTAVMKVIKKTTKGAHKAETKETDAKKAKTTATSDRNKAEIVKHGAAVDNAHENSRLAAAKKAEAKLRLLMRMLKLRMAKVKVLEAQALIIEAQALFKKARMYASAANLDSRALLDEAKKLIGCLGATKEEKKELEKIGEKD
jgi:hypothetical protein